jgi:hypothetical protein
VTLSVDPFVKTEAVRLLRDVLPLSPQEELEVYRSFKQDPMGALNIHWEKPDGSWGEDSATRPSAPARPPRRRGDALSWISLRTFLHLHALPAEVPDATRASRATSVQQRSRCRPRSGRARSGGIVAAATAPQAVGQGDAPAVQGDRWGVCVRVAARSGRLWDFAAKYFIDGRGGRRGRSTGTRPASQFSERCQARRAARRPRRRPSPGTIDEGVGPAGGSLRSGGEVKSPASSAAVNLTAMTLLGHGRPPTLVRA